MRFLFASRYLIQLIYIAVNSIWLECQEVFLIEFLSHTRANIAPNNAAFPNTLFLWHLEKENGVTAEAQI